MFIRSRIRERAWAFAFLVMIFQGGLLRAGEGGTPTFADLATPVSTSESFRPFGAYFKPNEPYPARALPVFQAAPEGAYVSVGTERGFIGAALSPRVTHLILVDRDVGINNYNRINVLLLRMAKDIADYRRLRLQPEIDEWISRAGEAALTEVDQQMLREYFGVWKSDVVNNSSFRAFHKEPSDSGSKFYGANYLWNEELFARIQTFAKEGRISVGNLDFSRTDAVQAVAKEIEGMGVKLSVLDISNAWWSVYLKKSDLEKVLAAFDRIAHPESLLLVTEGPSLSFVFQMIIDGALPWFYQGFTFGRIRSYSSYSAFLTALKIGTFFSVGQVYPKTQIDPGGWMKHVGRCLGFLKSPGRMGVIF